MQQPAAMIPVMPSFPQANITTEQIQKYLDENKRLILAILDNQNLGKLAECAQYQAQLQKNLMYLAAIADAQPQASAMPPQMAPHPAMQQAGYFAQHPQAAAAMMQQQQQSGLFPGAKMPMQYNSPHPSMQDPQQQQQQQQLHQQHQAAIHAQMAAMRPNNGMHHPMHYPDASIAGKQDASDGGAAAADSQGGGGGDGDDGK